MFDGWVIVLCIIRLDHATRADDGRRLEQQSDDALLTLGHYTLQQHRSWTRFGRLLVGLRSLEWRPPGDCALSGLMRHVVEQMLVVGGSGGDGDGGFGEMRL